MLDRWPALSKSTRVAGRESKTAPLSCCGCRDSLITCSFVTGIMSGIGMLLLLWPVVLEAGLSAATAFSHLRV